MSLSFRIRIRTVAVLAHLGRCYEGGRGWMRVDDGPVLCVPPTRQTSCSGLGRHPQ